MFYLDLHFWRPLYFSVCAQRKLQLFFMLIIINTSLIGLAFDKNACETNVCTQLHGWWCNCVRFVRNNNFTRPMWHECRYGDHSCEFPRNVDSRTISIRSWTLLRSLRRHRLIQSRMTTISDTLYGFGPSKFIWNAHMPNRKIFLLVNNQLISQLWSFPCLLVYQGCFKIPILKFSYDITRIELCHISIVMSHFWNLIYLLNYIDNRNY